MVKLIAADRLGAYDRSIQLTPSAKLTTWSDVGASDCGDSMDDRRRSARCRSTSLRLLSALEDLQGPFDRPTDSRYGPDASLGDSRRFFVEALLSFGIS